MLQVGPARTSTALRDNIDALWLRQASTNVDRGTFRTRVVYSRPRGGQRHSKETSLRFNGNGRAASMVIPTVRVGGRATASGPASQRKGTPC